jgi:tetratricopeptide (TPR) repeat protein
MNGRTSFGLLAFSILLGSSGCVTTQTQTPSEITTPAGLNKSEEQPIPTRKADGPKRTPKAATELAFGKFKENEAESEAGKANPEMQARLRDEARRAYQNAIKIDPNQLQAHRCLGALYIKTNDFERAIDIYKKALAKYPNESILWYDIALAHQRHKDLPESLKCLNKALEMDPENRDYMKKLGFTLAWMGQVDQGLTYLTRSQGPALAHYNIARILLQRDQNQLARYHLNMALQGNSQMTEARDLLATLDSPSARN